MKTIFSTILLILSIQVLQANELVKSSTCKGCHPVIYSEFYNSSHRKASIFENKVHKAMWDLHPNKTDKKYTCAKCHTPSDLELLEKLEKNKNALPIKNDVQTEEAISCAYCHSIKDVESHEKINKNILSLKEKLFYSANVEDRNEKNKKFEDKVSFFGMVKEKSGSPFHKIDYTNNNYYTGKMCMGCHSHMKNDNNFNLCAVEEEGAQDESKNCISCHMPKIAGSKSSVKVTKEHTFHGFTNKDNQKIFLDKYIKIDFKENKENFEISIKNEATHNLFLQPLRVAVLKVNILRDNNVIKLKDESFVRIIGKDGKATMPWLADSEVKNNMIKANETRVIPYDFKLKTNDTIELVFGYFKVNPKIVEKLNLQDDLESTQFNILHTATFYAK